MKRKSIDTIIWLFNKLSDIRYSVLKSRFFSILPTFVNLAQNIRFQKMWITFAKYSFFMWIKWINGSQVRFYAHFLSGIVEKLFHFLSVYYYIEIKLISFLCTINGNWISARDFIFRQLVLIYIKYYSSSIVVAIVSLCN